jgi:hypothetical protein
MFISLPHWSINKFGVHLVSIYRGFVGGRRPGQQVHGGVEDDWPPAGAVSCGIAAPSRLVAEGWWCEGKCVVGRAREAGWRWRAGAGDMAGRRHGGAGEGAKDGFWRGVGATVSEEPVLVAVAGRGP